jgi:hypothetical protein
MKRDGNCPPKSKIDLAGGDKSSLRDDAVGPLDQADKDRWIAEFCAPLIYVRFRDPTGPAAGPSSKNGNVFREDLVERFAERRPTHWNDGARSGFAHQRSSFTEKENLNLVARLCER